MAVYPDTLQLGTHFCMKTLFPQQRFLWRKINIEQKQIQSTLVISNLTGPDKKFELSVVRDNQSVTSRVCLGVPIVCYKVLERHKYEYSELKTLSCPAVELLLFVLGLLIAATQTSINN